ncbi:MAG: hypothetical protein N2109_01975 [Fimbriimonadales bacterium]|nr:hypothetical protein [Fimbriimonadales bacterium]
MLAAFLALTAVTRQAPDLALYRGAPLPARPTPQARYWDVADTTLDARLPESNFGGSTVLRGGPGRSILLRFGDLARAIGPGKRVVDARLRLTLFDGKAAAPRSVASLQAPWGEGPVRTIETPEPAIGKETPAPRWSSTWRFRRAGEQPIPWRGAGAAAAGDAKALEGWKAQTTETELIVEGLAQEVQRQYRRWYDNHGIVLTFDEPVQFFSSEAARGRPVLELRLAEEPPKTGPDLSVTYIERLPEYERYDNRGAYTYKEQNGHTAGVMDKPGLADSKKWPADGETVAYVAHVKNVGDAPAQGFLFRWIVREVPGAASEASMTLLPGQEATFKLEKPFRNFHADHRTQPIAFRIEPTGPDANPYNDCVEIQENALAIGIWVEQAFYERFGQETNHAGSRAFEDWIQEQFRLWNGTFFPYSRFSFAPDGILERTRVARITIVPNGTLKGGAHLPNDAPTLIYDGEWGFEGSMAADGYIASVRRQADLALLHELSHQIGLMDLYTMNVDPSRPDGTGGKVRLKEGGSTPTRGFYDRFGGLMGGGDTRNEAMVPRAYPIPYEPWPDAFLDSMSLEATDLYSATDAFALNSLLGFRRGFYGEFLYALPNVSVVRAVDLSGQPLRNVELAFFQMSQGAIPDAPPVFTVTTDANGTARLPARDTLEPAPFTTKTGFTLRPNPFGRIDVVGSNGVFLVRARAHGATEWAFLKLWHLVDGYARGQRAAQIRELRFNLPGMPLDEAANAAKDRFVLDSAGTPPAELSRIVDGDRRRTVQLPGKAGDWIEIDLGRDRPIGDVRLWSDTTDFWRRFDVLVYSTGQTAADARPFAREGDWRWTATNRKDADPGDARWFQVSYRGNPVRVRFVRLVCREDTPFARLSEIEVVPVRPTEAQQ